MNRSTQAQIDSLLDRAEAAESCLCFPGETNSPAAQRARRRLRDGRLLSPHKGAFVRPDTWKSLDPRMRDLWSMRALTRLHPDWVFCGHSAAEAHGLWVPWRPHGPLQATRLIPRAEAPSRARSRTAPGIECRKRPASSCTYVRGIRTELLDDTAVACLCEMPFMEGLGVADSWLRFTGRPRTNLLALIELRGKGLRGVRQARATAAHADPRSENGGESFSRARIIELGYMLPDLQVWMPDPLDPWSPKRVDFLWEKPDGTRVVGEFDGRGKYTRPELMDGLTPEGVRERERLRESRLAVPGVAVMRFGESDVKDTRRFCALLEAYGIPRKPRGR